jgi:hypothetical protein
LIVAVRGVGLAAPAVLLVSFLPMFCIACSSFFARRPEAARG